MLQKNMLQESNCKEAEVLRLINLYIQRSQAALEQAQKGMNVHTETNVVRGIVSQAELVWEFDQIVAVWEPILEHFEERESEFYMSDLSNYVTRLRQLASDDFTQISFERLTRWNFYEQKARLTVAQRLSDIFQNVYVKRDAA